jgi:mannitol operon repressor
MEDEKPPENAWEPSTEPTAYSDSVREIRFESDRGAMLVGAAFIDGALYALLKAIFVDSATAVKRVLEYPGPCSALSARADVALATGAIGSEMHADIRRIARMRNRFAHDSKRATFEQPEVVDSCKKFNVIRSMTLSGTQMSISAKTQFLITVAAIVNKLEFVIRTTNHAQKGPSYDEMPSHDCNIFGYWIAAPGPTEIGETGTAWTVPVAIFLNLHNTPEDWGLRNTSAVCDGANSSGYPSIPRMPIRRCDASRGKSAEDVELAAACRYGDRETGTALTDDFAPEWWASW